MSVGVACLPESFPIQKTRPSLPSTINNQQNTLNINLLPVLLSSIALRAAISKQTWHQGENRISEAMLISKNLPTD